MHEHRRRKQFSPYRLSDLHRARPLIGKKCRIPAPTKAGIVAGGIVVSLPRAVLDAWKKARPHPPPASRRAKRPPSAPVTSKSHGSASASKRQRPANAAGGCGIVAGASFGGWYGAGSGRPWNGIAPGGGFSVALTM